MKKIYIVIICLLIPFIGFSYSYNQGKQSYINEISKKCMNGFVFEDAVYENVNYFDADTKFIEIEFTPYSNEYYKLINASKGFKDSTTVEIYHNNHIIKQRFAPLDTTCKETIIGTKETVKPVTIRFYYSYRDAISNKSKIVFLLGYHKK